MQRREDCQLKCEKKKWFLPETAAVLVSTAPKLRFAAGDKVHLSRHKSGPVRAKGAAEPVKEEVTVLLPAKYQNPSASEEPQAHH